MEQKQKTIYDLELHERIDLDYEFYVIKVHGGWIYKLGQSSTFVPYQEPIRDAKAGVEVPKSLMDACKNQSNEKETD